MGSVSDTTTSNTTLQYRNVSENVTLYTNLSFHFQTVRPNRGFHNGCLNVVFSDMEYIPWDNPDNIVSLEVERVARLIKNTMLILLFLIGGPANVINMAVFYKQGLRDRVNLCLFALSLADELCVFNAVVHHGEQIHIQFTTGERFGPISTFLSNSNMVVLLNFHYVSYILSAIIATERCVCVFNPLKCQNLLSTKAMAAVIITVYIVVPGLFFLAAFRYRVGCIYDMETGETVITSVEGTFFRAHKEMIEPLEGFVFGVCLPGAVMIVVMTTTMMTIVKLRQTLKWRAESTSRISAREVALTKTLVANSIFFIVCLFPITVNRFSWLFFPEVNSGRRMHNTFLTGLWIGTLFTYANGTFNIFVYYFMGSRYREVFRELFGRKIQPEKRQKGKQPIFMTSLGK